MRFGEISVGETSAQGDVIRETVRSGNLVSEQNCHLGNCLSGKTLTGNCSRTVKAAIVMIMQ